MGSVSAQESLKMEEKANQRGGSWGGSAQSWQLWRWRKGPQAKECRQPLSRRWKSFHPKSLPKECSLTNTLILASLNFELWCWRRLLSPLDCKEIQPIHPKGDRSWVFIGRTDAEAEIPILWPPHGKSWLLGKDWFWEGLGAGGEGDDRGLDGWMASPTWWTWVWVNSESWWWTGRPDVLQFMGSQSRTRLSDWTELKRVDLVLLFQW